MRIAGWEVKAKRVGDKELGATGTSTMVYGGGILLAEEDYNPDLRGKAFFDQIDRMRLADSQVKSVMSILKLPLLAADWSIEPASDDDQDIEIAEWIEDRFFNQQTRTWDYILRHILLCLDFGAMPFEIVWQTKDDDMLKRPMIHLHKLAPRMPRSVMEWYLDEEGNLSSIKQMVEKNGRYQEIEIPGERLIVFVHEMEGANYRGTSILRQARKDWYIKERLQRINQVAIEKRASGIDVGKLTEEAQGTPEQSNAFESVLQTIRTHERSYVLLPKGHDFSIQGIAGAVLDPLPSIQYCDLMILRGILADFLVSGTDASHGSYAMVRDRSSFFLMSLGAIANELTAPINRELIPKWVNWNWPNITQFPTLEHSRIDRRDVGVIATALQGLIPVGAITPDDGMEQELRELLEMPDLPEQSNLSRLVGKSGDNLIKEYKKQKTPRPLEISSLRPRTKAELAVDWIVLERGLEIAENKIVKAYQGIQDRQISKIIDEAMKVIESDRPADEKAQTLEDINIPYKKEAAAAVSKVLIELYGLGQREVKQEMARMGGEPLRLALPLDAESDAVIKGFLRFRALAMIGELANRLKGSLLNNGLNMIREAQTDRLMIAGAITSLSDQIIKRLAGETVTEAMNIGRESVAKRNEALVEEIQYSAIMDKNVCDSCAALDGRTFKIGTEEYEAAKPPRQVGGPIPECHGRNRCRCVYIYTFRSEAPAVR